MLLRLLLSLGFFIPSMAFSSSYYEELVQKIDPNKKTVCNITINSDDEKKTFQKRLSSKEFNFVELINPKAIQANGKNPPWFQQACSSGVECDVLLISGHFGGSFFGKSGFRLSTEDLEYQSCNNRCDGILKKPKEIFLFGCNTLAGKEKDHRTPEEYRQVLLDDGFGLFEADQIAAFRYSNVGSTFYDRMRSVFSNSRLYGFDSVSPTGKNIKPMVNSYLKQFKSYSYHLNNFQKNSFNQNWKKIMSRINSTQTEGLKSEVSEKICLMTDPKKSNSEKIKTIKNLLFDLDNILSNLPIVNIYFKNKNKEDELKIEDIYSLNEIKNNTEASSLFKKYINKKNFNFMSIKNQMINIGWYVNWWSLDDAIRLMRENVIDFNSLDDDSDFLCSLDIPYSYKEIIKFEDLPEREWNENILKIIECFDISNDRVFEKISSEFSSYEEEAAMDAAADALCEIKFNEGLTNQDLPTSLLTARWLRLVECSKIDEEVKNRILSEFSSYKDGQLYAAAILCKVDPNRELDYADLPKGFLSRGWLKLIGCVQPDQEVRERILSEFSNYGSWDAFYAEITLCKIGLGRKLTNADLPIGRLSKEWLDLMRCLKLDEEVKRRVILQLRN